MKAPKISKMLEENERAKFVLHVSLQQGWDFSV